MGGYCKVIGAVPRHEAIVAEILGAPVAGWATPLIGIGEILLGIWIATGSRRRTTAVVQIILVLSMNVLELSLASELLLWGSLNFGFALLFCLLVYWNGFHNPRSADAQVS